MSTYERINFYCKENHITGKEIGEKLGLKKSPLTDWKNNKSKPTIDQIKLFAKYSQFQQTIYCLEKMQMRI